jgi:zinc-binding alcohol dehydrogenase family protein
VKAIGYDAPKPVEDESCLFDLDLPEPAPGPRDLLVSVRAVSVNPVDVKQRSRVAPPAGQTRVLGFDAAGVVEKVGAEVTLFRPGDEVFYAGQLDRPGTNSELHVVDERLVGRKPKSIDFTRAAALPLTSITAWELLFERLGVPRDPKAEPGTLLVINGAGGVGSILVQMARQLTGLTVVATASRPETIAWCRDMGAHHVVDHRRPLHEAVRDIGLGPIESVAGLTATDRHLPAILELIAPHGRLALVDDPASLDIVGFKHKSVSVHWEFMFTRSMFATPDRIAQHRLLCEVADLVDAGVLRSTFTEDGGAITAANLRRAHATAESGRAIGKTVLTGF